MIILKTSAAVFFFMICSSVFSQSARQYLKAGDANFDSGDYYGAIVNYQAGLDKNSSNQELMYKMAEASRMIYDYAKAEKYYAEVFKNDEKNRYPEAALYLGLMRKTMGRYSDAKNLFNHYLEKNKDKDTYFTRKAKQEKSACEFVAKWKTDSLESAVTHLGNGVNTIFSEWSPVILHDSILYFSSLRADTNSTLLNPDQKTKLFYSVRRNNKWDEALEADSNFNKNGFHAGNASFSIEGKKMYFTVCETDEKGKAVCKIMISKFENGLWSIPVFAGGPVNISGYTSSHPSAGMDFNGNEILFFSSDRSGGFGKSDIWYAVKNIKGEFEMPVNAGPAINSEDDEISPFFHSPTQTLYFSSDWHKGFGGFDVFRSRSEEGKISFTSIENLGRPVNSGYNDLYLTTLPDPHQGYFSSNRPGSLTVKGETCCNDIYSFQPVIPREIVIVKKERESGGALKTEEIKIDTLPNVLPPVEKKLADLKELVPITLYFNNDEPNPRTTAIVTKANYTELYKKYLSAKREVIKKYAEGLDESSAKKAELDVEDFFDLNVSGGYFKLEQFAKILKEILEDGRGVTVTLKGYCSPLASTDYNKNLARRRISSLRNYFEEYDKGSLKEYISGNSTAVLSFKEEDIGEEFADSTVSDDLKDKRSSVYSPKASRERRIQIIAVYSSE